MILKDAKVHKYGIQHGRSGVLCPWPGVAHRIAAWPAEADGCQSSRVDAGSAPSRVLPRSGRRAVTEEIRLPDLSTDKDFEGDSFTPIYTTTVTVSGGTTHHGRASGRARSTDGVLDLDLRMPAELGGDGRGTNPEQLYAAGCAACFHGALSLLARQAGLDNSAISVEATVAFGRDP
jgi:hypothetical protein